MLINGKPAPLGKKFAVKDSRTLQLVRYLRPAAFNSSIANVDWLSRLTDAEVLQMYLNDQIGDCVAAAAGHMIQQWNFYAGHSWRPSENEIVKSYEDVGGFLPGDPSTDNGMNMLAFLNYWRTVGIGGHKIVAFAQFDPRDPGMVRLALRMFGNAFTGLALPESAIGKYAWKVCSGGLDSVAGQSGSWGLHCVPILRSSLDTLTCITWGSALEMTDEFFADYADEAYCVLSQDWINASGLSPDGFDFNQLQQDLAAVTASKRPT